MACPRCKAETRYVLNEARTEILGTSCTACDWKQGPGLAVNNAGEVYPYAKPLQFIQLTTTVHYTVMRVSMEGQPWRVLALRDCSAELGGLTITNAAEQVVSELSRDLADTRIIYRDTEGRWDELRHDGKRFTGFRSLRARSMDEALEALEQVP